MYKELNELDNDGKLLPLVKGGAISTSYYTAYLIYAEYQVQSRSKYNTQEIIFNNVASKFGVSVSTVYKAIQKMRA
jgi:DNA invertase Pin-like site-specific DNA recombinase